MRLEYFHKKLGHLKQWKANMEPYQEKEYINFKFDLIDFYHVMDDYRDVVLEYKP